MNPAPFRHPFAGDEPTETLFFIPPSKKGSVDEGIAGVRPVRIRISILPSPAKGFNKRATAASPPRCPS